MLQLIAAAFKGDKPLFDLRAGRPLQECVVDDAVCFNHHGDRLIATPLDAGDLRRIVSELSPGEAFVILRPFKAKAATKLEPTYLCEHAVYILTNEGMYHVDTDPHPDDGKEFRRNGLSFKVVRPKEAFGILSGDRQAVEA
jgi:hypothetical protein